MVCLYPVSTRDGPVKHSQETDACTTSRVDEWISYLLSLVLEAGPLTPADDGGASVTETNNANVILVCTNFSHVGNVLLHH